MRRYIKSKIWQLGDIRRNPQCLILVDLNQSSNSRTVVEVVANKNWEVCDMTRMISRRKAFSLLGLAAALGLAASTTALVSDAEAETAGMERREARRTGRHERREARRSARETRRQGRRSARETRREAR